MDMISTRREWLRGLAAAAGACAAGCGSLPREQGIGLACQMWSVNDIWRKDLAGTLARMREMGYRGVQSMAFWDWDRAELRKVLRENDLRIVDMPIHLDRVAPDKLSSTVDFCGEFGIDFLFVPHYNGKAPWTEWRKLGDGMCEAAAKLARWGIRMGFHNHQVEFKIKSAEGVSVMENYMSRPELFFELDVGHAKLAGDDPVALLKRLAGRVPSIHAKPAGGNSTGGAGDANDWPAIFAAARTGGVKWAVVECETRRDRFDDIAASAAFLKGRL